MDRLKEQELATQYAKLMLSLPISEDISPDLHLLCRAYLQSLSQEAVRDEVLEEVLEEAARVCEGLIPKNAGTQFGQWRDEYDAYERCARHIRKCAKTLKREPNAAGRESDGEIAHAMSMTDDGPAPAAPESETPLIERLRKSQWDETAHRGEFNKAIQAGAPIPILEMVESVARLCGEAATALSLAQTEIKGHMRIAKEVRIEALKEAAEACELERVAAEETGDAGDIAYNLACQHCATAIRALLLKSRA